MDLSSEQVGYWVIVGTIIFSIWRLRRVFLASYLEDGFKMFNFLLTPFAVYYGLKKDVRDARDEWAEETIAKHESKQTDANS